MRLNRGYYLEVIEHAKKEIEKNGIEILDIFNNFEEEWLNSWHSRSKEVDNYTHYYYDMSINFWGKDKNGRSSIYNCSFTVDGISIDVFGYQWDLPTAEPTQMPDGIKITDLLQNAKLDPDFDVMLEPVDKIIYRGYNNDDMEVLYSYSIDLFLKKTTYNYLKIVTDEEGTRAEVVREVASIIDANGCIYIHPDTASPEFDFTSSPYICTGITGDDVEKVKKSMEDVRQYTYKEVYKTDAFLLFSVGTAYFIVLKQGRIRYDIEDQLHEKNNYFLGTNKEIEEVIPVPFSPRFDSDVQIGQYYKNNVLIKSFGNEDVTGFYKEDDEIVKSDDLYLIKYTDGTYGFLCVGPLIQRDDNNPCKRKDPVRKLTFIDPSHGEER